MDIDGYIRMNTEDVATKPRLTAGEFVNHVTFRVLYNLDNGKDEIIPSSFRQLRFIELIEYLINSQITNKNNIFYHLSYRYTSKYLQLDTVVFKFLTLVELNKLSMILPATDILEYIKFKPSEPYFMVDRPDKVCYDLYCEVSWEIKK